MFGLGAWELVVVLFVVLIIFGPGRLPDLGTGLGEGIRNFKKGFKDSKALDVSDKDKTSVTVEDPKKIVED